MAKKAPRYGSRQGALLIGNEPAPMPEKPRISREYDGKVAKAFGQQRRKRTGELAIHARNVGFMQNVRNLWVPAHGTENKAITTNPEAIIVLEKYHARERVLDKYKNSEIDPRRIMRWAHFSAQNVEINWRGKHRQYWMDSRKNFVHLCGGLYKDLSYDYHSITSSEIAMDSLALYVVRLTTFVDEDKEVPPPKSELKAAKAVLEAFGGGEVITEKKVRRKWLYDHYVRKIAAAKLAAFTLMESMQPADVSDLFGEALYSEWSRNMYWTIAQESPRDLRRALNSWEPEWEPVPIEQYANIPEYYGHLSEARENEPM